MNNDPTTYQITINLTGDEIDALQDILQTVSEMARFAPISGPEFVTTTLDNQKLWRLACALAWHGLNAQRIARALADAGDTAEPIPSPDFPDWND